MRALLQKEHYGFFQRMELNIINGQVLNNDH